MKKIIVAAALLLVAALGWTMSAGKLYITSTAKMGEYGVTDFFYVEDLETGTRCYSVVHANGVSISCVPKQK